MHRLCQADRAVDRADPLRMLHRPPPGVEREWAAQHRREAERHDEAWAREFEEVRSHADGAAQLYL